MKILRPFTATGGVFFPVGRPPKGTCEFSTKNCEKHCYTKNYSHFDFETNISEEEKWKIYKIFMQKSVRIIVREIENNLDGLQTPILHWFGTGDCMIKDMEKISDIINAIPGYIVQMGFIMKLNILIIYT